MADTYVETEGFVVAELALVAGVVVECGDCDWKGLSEQLTPIKDCALDAGSTVPAGRCPGADCNSLAYIVEAPDHTLELLAFVELVRDGNTEIDRLEELAATLIQKAERCPDVS